jgi:hypothetical protein
MARWIGGLSALLLAAASPVGAQVAPYNPHAPTLPPGADPSLMNPLARIGPAAPPSPQLFPPPSATRDGPKPAYVSPICQLPRKTRSRDLEAYCATLGLPPS